MSRDQLIEVYLDYRNNFITIEGFAKYYGFHYSEAERLITLAREVFNTAHPEA